ncbi:MAG: RDD family protein [Bacteroidota bacterium]
MNIEKFKIPKFILASKNIRIINFIIDYMLVYIIVFISVLIIDAIFMAGKIPIANKIDSLDLIERYMFWCVVHFFYYGITETFLSQSFAKYFTKTVVVMEDGSKPKVIDILARTTLRLVPFEYFTFLQGRKPGLHDEYSKTFVVRKDKLEKYIIDFNENVKIKS